MPHMIEAAKSGRASCRSCKQTIEKGTLRLGEEVPNAFSPGEMTYQWHHLKCAAEKRPASLKQALETTDIAVEDKEELLKTCEESGKNQKPTNFPYAEHAPTGRASCISCSEKIEKGDLRIAVESEVDTGSFQRRGAGYLHPACAPDHVEEDPVDLFEKIKANTLNLPADEMAALEEEMCG